MIRNDIHPKLNAWGAERKMWMNSSDAATDQELGNNLAKRDEYVILQQALQSRKQ